ncbi:MAG: hypothetical protein AAFN81_21235 [Bacteroidota bacterium]
MRAIFTLFLTVLLASSCVNPLKLLDAEDYERAYKVSKRQLAQRIRRDKPASTGELVTLHDSYFKLQDRTIQQITDLHEEGQPSRWLRIYPLYIELLERHMEVQTYTHLYTHFTFRYDRSSLERLIEQSRLNAGAYCFDQAATSFPAARANEKIAARTAYRWLLRALKYVPEDNSYQDHLAEMYDWGTVRIFVQGLSYFNPAWFPLETTFASSGLLLHHRDWIEVHYNNAVQRRIDYEAIVDVTEVYVGRNEEVESTECFSAEVITGYRTETKKVWQDSVWVEKKEEVPIYTTVTATITTVEQYKEAWSRAQIQLIPVAGLRPGTWWNTAPSVDWSNTYEVCSGDDRALPSSCSGSCAFYPSDRSMVRDLGRAIRRNLLGQLCHYFPDTHLRRRDRKALGW